MIIAHRGASGVAPENTLPAINSTISAGADCIEIDVHLSKDGHVVVMHDKTVDRTTNGTGRISELDSAYLKSLDAGSWFTERYAGTRIPFLEEVINKIDGKTKLLIELKEGENSKALVEKVAETIQKEDAADWCIAQSFSDDILEQFDHKWPEIPLHKLIVFKFRFLPFAFDGGISRFDFDKYQYVAAVNMHKCFASNSFLGKIHSAGKNAHAWGCRKKSSCKASEMQSWDGVITDYPGNYKNK